uniref:Uncharacterized protein n=1 Tax=viral metagenome TaxID=1070528 RepID=A0A6M3LGE8_9ZZZZ
MYSSAQQNSRQAWREYFMVQLPVNLEIDRLMNLIRGFGWEIEEKKETAETITVTIKKKIVTE